MGAGYKKEEKDKWRLFYKYSKSRPIQFIRILEIWTLPKIAGAIKILSVLLWKMTCCLHMFLKDHLF